MIDSPRLRNALADRNLRTWLVAAMVLLAAAILGSRASILWLVLPCACLAIVVLARRPILGLVATIATAMLIPFELGTGREVSLNLAALLIPATFALWFLIMVRHRDLHLPRSRTTPPLLLFILASLLSLVVGNAYWDPGVPRPGNILLVQLGQWGIFAFSALAFWLMGSLVRNEIWLRRLTFFYLTIAGLLAIIRVMPGTARIREVIATFALDRAPFWLLLAALAAGQLLFNRDLSTRWRLFLLVAMGAVIAYAFFIERKTLSNLVGVAPVLGVLAWFRWPRLRLAYILLAFLAVTVFTSVFFDFAGGEAEWDESGGSRLVLAGRVVEVTMRNPITGLGPASYRAYARMKPLPYQRAYWVDPQVNSHNNYVDLFAHGGLLGLALFFWFSAEVIRLGWRLRARFADGFSGGYVNAMLAAWIGALLLMVFADWILPHVYNIGFPGFQASVLVWIFLGGLVALEQMGGGGGKKMRVNLSIIIVNWNTRDMLAQCLESVMSGQPSWSPEAQHSEMISHQSSVTERRLPNVEVFVVDNASTDGSTTMVRERFPWVDLVESYDNLGFAAGNNLAMRQATGELFLLLNPDTIVQPEAITHLVKSMQANPRLGVVGAQLLNPDGSLQTSWGMFPSLGTELPLLNRLGMRHHLQRAVGQSGGSLALSPVEWVCGACLMIRRQVVEEIGLLDVAYWLYTEETDWCYRAYRAGWQIALSPAALVYHIARAASRQRFAATMLHFYQSRVRFIRKHRGDMQADIVRRLYCLRALLWQSHPDSSPLALAFRDLPSTEICAAYRQLQQAMSQPLDYLLASKWQ